MHDEDGFLAAIRQTPADNTARLVFADWLDEQQGAISKTKAAFIRLELQIAAAPVKSLNHIRWLAQYRKHVSQLDSAWLAVVSRPGFEARRFALNEIGPPAIPEPPLEEREPRRPTPRHRKTRRSRHSNLQREDWEEPE